MCLANCVLNLVGMDYLLLRLHIRPDPDRQILPDIHMVDRRLLFLPHHRRFLCHCIRYRPHLSSRRGGIPSLCPSPVNIIG